MSRKRSLKARYFRLLRRIWPAPTLAALLFSLGACASQPVTGAHAGAHPASAATATSHAPEARDELWHDWAPQLLPTQLQLAPEFRSACAPVAALPPSLVLHEHEHVVDVLEPIAACLTLGPLVQERLHLLGPTDLPGRWDAPVDGSGRADQLRSSLSLLGVPFQNLITHDVDSGSEVELAIAPDPS